MNLLYIPVSQFLMIVEQNSFFTVVVKTNNINKICRQYDGYIVKKFECYDQDHSILISLLLSTKNNSID